MRFFRPFTARLLAAFALLSVAGATGCRKYVNEPIGFAGWGFNDERYDMQSTDDVTITYPIEGPGTVNISNVRVQSTEPTITSSFSQVDSDGLRQVYLTIRTNNTPGGTYPVRISIINQDGTFIERAATIEIVNFVKLLNESTGSYPVDDTLDDRPFDPQWARPRWLYSTEIKHRPGDPANRFVFSTLCTLFNYGPIDDVIVDVDSVSGKVVAPPQNIGLNNFALSGQLSRFDGYKKVKGYFIYTYRTSGSEYEGHLSF